MPEIVLRFYGRFVFAQPAVADGSLHVLAVHMTCNPDVPADPHQLLMAVPRGLIRREGTRPPNLVIAMAPPPTATRDDEKRLEHFVWNLGDHEVTVVGGDGFAWEDKSQLIDFGELTTATLQSEVATGKASGGSVAAAVRLSNGTGIARQFVDMLYDFVELGDQLTPVLVKKRLADLVEITIKPPSDVPEIALKLARRGQNGPSSSIVIGTEGEIPTIVTFSHLCSRRPTSLADEEFSGLYEVLADPPLTRRRLIPVGRPTANSTEDCYSPVFATFRR